MSRFFIDPITRKIVYYCFKQQESHYYMPDQYTKEELATRLRNALSELDKVADEIILTYLED